MKQKTDKLQSKSTKPKVDYWKGLITLARAIRREKKTNPTSRNERGNTTSDSTDGKRKIKGQYYL